MTKAAIRNEQPFRGRNKGNTEGRVTNEKHQKSWEEIEWSTPQFCEECWKKPCQCKVVANDSKGRR